MATQKLCPEGSSRPRCPGALVAVSLEPHLHCRPGLPPFPATGLLVSVCCPLSSPVNPVFCSPLEQDGCNICSQCLPRADPPVTKPVRLVCAHLFWFPYSWRWCAGRDGAVGECRCGLDGGVPVGSLPPPNPSRELSLPTLEALGAVGRMMSAANDTAAAVPLFTSVCGGL